ncbi:hypothetical protein JW758_06330 [Candidatus Peregrinibacteria bacterium]|nr:hypothetical protein [Candidatus Peregrinibacteria bacterium]
MKNTNNNIYLKIVLVCLVIAFVYLGLAYAMRDKSDFWCSLSSGKYELVIRCSGRDDSTGRPTGCESGPDRLCSGGFFDSYGVGRHDKSSLSIMKAATN